jgi:F-type H+-transporting ATPase subunit b
MTFDWWGLGIQATNVLILVWLLNRLFWRPIAGAINRRQEAMQAMLDEGKTTQAKADAALTEVAEAQAGIAAERHAKLAEAKATADTVSEVAREQAKAEADAMLADARTAIDHERNTARKENATKAAELSVEIAAHLLGRFSTTAVRETFLTQLVAAITHLSESDRVALIGSEDGTEIVTATDIEDVEKTKIEHLIREALGGTPKIRFVTDPSLIAGLELRSGYFVLHNSWKADLTQILKEIEDVA